MMAAASQIFGFWILPGMLDYNCQSSIKIHQSTAAAFADVIDYGIPSSPNLCKYKKKDG
jgi:hypothetical protein